eukprot:10092212-Prorocentrum_lima.AAC.1
MTHHHLYHLLLPLCLNVRNRLRSYFGSLHTMTKRLLHTTKLSLNGAAPVSGAESADKARHRI